MPVKHLKDCILSSLIFICSVVLNGIAVADEYSKQRQQMISEIEDDIQITVRYINKKAFDPRVMQTLSTIPRHKFVPESLRSSAYVNRPLSIGYGQTISQPYIVALMTDLLQPEAGHRVLEIGTGSGYQAAVLAELVSRVYSIEIIEALGMATEKLLTGMGYDNIETRIADGYNGWPEQAPFDSIIVTAGISHIPPPLVQQLKKGGRMLIPVGTRFQTQYLTLVKKDMEGKVTTQQLLPVYFVPFTGGH